MCIFTLLSGNPRSSLHAISRKRPRAKKRMVRCRTSRSAAAINIFDVICDIYISVLTFKYTNVENIPAFKVSNSMVLLYRIITSMFNFLGHY